MKRRNGFFIAALSLAGLVAGAAMADPADDASALDRFIASPQRIAGLSRTVSQTLTVLAKDCRAPTAKSGTTMKVLTPFTFTPEGVAVQGVFLERAPIDACGTALTVNVLSRATPTGGIDRHILVPGETLAGPTLQRDIIIAARTAAFGDAPDAPCKGGHVANTHVTAPPVSDRWSETWDMAGCGRVVSVDVALSKGVTGTDYRVTRTPTKDRR